MKVFSMRHKKGLVEGRIKVSVPERLRNRIWSTLTDYNQSFRYQPDPNDNWTDNSDYFEQTEKALQRVLGQPTLRVKDIETNAWEQTDLEGMLKRGYPSSVFDVVEMFYRQLSAFEAERSLASFQRDLNEALSAYDSCWRLADGRFFPIETDFLVQEVIKRADSLLKTHEFEGAFDEFREAREELLDGNTKDAIHKSFKSFESCLKTIVNKHHGDVTDLLTDLRQQGYLDDVPEPVAKALCNQVLRSVAVLRNQLGGHGQGSTIVSVPRSYAALAVQMAGALNIFLVQQYVGRTPATPILAQPNANTALEDDDVPF